jgi:hypothetical protein
MSLFPSLRIVNAMPPNRRGSWIANSTTLTVEVGFGSSVGSGDGDGVEVGEGEGVNVGLAVGVLLGVGIGVEVDNSCSNTAPITGSPSSGSLI